MTKKKELRDLLIGIIGVFIGLLVEIFLGTGIVQSFPQPFKAISVIILYWLIALVPLCIIFLNKEKLKDYILGQGKVYSQILTGIVLAIGMSLVFTFIPHLLGFGEYVEAEKRYTEIWQFAYEFTYCILSVGAVEELVFRGFIYERIKRISGKEIIAVMDSSVLFGAFHFMTGNIVQIFITALLGMFFCFCRIKIKNCSLLSLMIAHGLYDAMITVWASLLLR